MPGGFAGGPAGVLAGWALTAVGLALAGPGLTYLCGRLLQSVRPGGCGCWPAGCSRRRRGASAGRWAWCARWPPARTPALHRSRPAFGPLTTLGALLVAGCTLLTLVTAAVEAKQDRADTTAALLRLGAPAATCAGRRRCGSPHCSPRSLR